MRISELVYSYLGCPAIFTPIIVLRPSRFGCLALMRKWATTWRNHGKAERIGASNAGLCCAAGILSATSATGEPFHPD